MNKRHQDLQHQIEQRQRLLRAYEDELAVTSDPREIERIERNIARERVDIARFWAELAQLEAAPDAAEALATYRAWVVRSYGKMQLLGMSSATPLQQIFTDVYILPKPTLMRRFSLENLHERFLEQARDVPLRYDERVAADELIQTADKLFILGKLGAGKTTFCKHLAVGAAKGEGQVNKVPIFVTLKQYADSGLSLRDYINGQFDAGGFSEALSFVEALLRNGKGLLLFDGLDEVTKDHNGRNRVAAEINAFTRKYNGCHIVVTCRVAATDYSFEDFRYVEMAEFAPEQVESFVRQWFLQGEADVGKGENMLAELKQHEGISDLTRNPLLLTLLCLNYDETMAFPARRVEIYQDALEALLKKWDSSRGIQRGSAYGSLSLGRKQEMLAEIAYDTYREGRYFFARRELEPRLAEYVAGAPEVPAKIDIDGEIILQEIVAQHGLLTYRATDAISFSHKTFHEYFTAKQIVANREAGTFPELLQHAADDSWKEVFLLTVSQLRRDATSDFIKLFMKILYDNVVKHPRVIRSLAWAAQAANASISGYGQVTLRAFFARVNIFSIGLYFGSKRIIDRDPDFVLDHTLSLDYGRAIGRSIGLDLDLGTSSVFDLDLDPSLKVLVKALGQLEIPTVNASQQEWGKFAKELKGILDVHRPLGNYDQLEAERTMWAKERPDHGLTKSDLEMLIAFVRGSNRLYECLQVAYLLPAERKAFEEQLLLPPPCAARTVPGTE
ncbi:MAG: NACHT domain-containing protein [Chloroflexota bacterium]